MNIRGIFPICALASLSACEDRPQHWSESEIRAIARNEAEDFGGDAASAASVDFIVEDLAQRNADLQLEIDNLEATVNDQQAEIDAIHVEMDAARY